MRQRLLTSFLVLCRSRSCSHSLIESLPARVSLFTLRSVWGSVGWGNEMKGASEMNTAKCVQSNFIAFGELFPINFAVIFYCTFDLDFFGLNLLFYFFTICISGETINSTDEDRKCEAHTNGFSALLSFIYLLSFY